MSARFVPSIPDTPFRIVNLYHMLFSRFCHNLFDNPDLRERRRHIALIGLKRSN